MFSARIPWSASRRLLLVHRPIPFFPLRRCLSTNRLDPLIRHFAADLALKQPTFRVPSHCIRILSEPAQFYDLLLDMIQRAQHRIFISSLYIGSTESELLSSIDKALRIKPHLKVHFQLDLNRSTRPGPSSTAKILLPLLREFPSRVHVSMFRSPSLRGIFAKLVPPRFNEGWGTWHAKVYGADDEVMISGANLSKSYFTDRQDRYLHFSSQPALSQYCFDFLKTVSTFSYRLLPVMPTSLGRHSYTQDDYTLHWPDPQTHPHEIQQRAETLLKEFQKTYLDKSKSVSERLSTRNCIDATLFPLIQAGQINIHEEEMTFQLLFRLLKSLKNAHRPLLDLTSGYFSLYKPYQDLILSSPGVDCRIVAASPKANGFFGSNGISGRIPEGYTLYEQRFMKAVKKAGRLWKGTSGDAGKGVSLSEWAKQGWTYHAKGIWLSPSSSSLPVLTLFGSTNLNSRSAHLDTELSFLMLIPSEASGDHETKPSPNLPLRKALAQEVDRIRSHTVHWKGEERKVRFTTKIIVWLVKGML
ncbi:hypothetical protein K443DRAFT_220581 [Laccaria amethystina LaAM-08-1]|uniref:CDP-diacylglycerol--glycerol-3-phosphate 3-phosphatidyltransferase n=1 Tax=Laccaria amethystina LaAM-08-1 TaxID=1095629 RepID=A0A0C9XQ56_9AGAR|nr:hypothetical protein K443DRAFT_220581 [Laccaria amethystina LaAM-08-1]